MLAEAKCDLDAARVQLDACCFAGDILIVTGDGWKGEKVDFVEYTGQNVKISYNSKAYTVEQAQCRLFARADGTVLLDESEEQQYEEARSEEDFPQAEDERVAPLPKKKFTLWVDPNQGEGTFRYRPEHYDMPGVGGYVGLESTRPRKPVSLAGAKARLRAL